MGIKSIAIVDTINFPVEMSVMIYYHKKMRMNRQNRPTKSMQSF